MESDIEASIIMHTKSRKRKAGNLAETRLIRQPPQSNPRANYIEEVSLVKLLKGMMAKVI